MMCGSIYSSSSSRIPLLILLSLLANLLLCSDAFTPSATTRVASFRSRSILASSTTTHLNDVSDKRSVDVNNSEETDESIRVSPGSKPLRWGSKLNPTVRARLVKAGQNRAIANKNKREPTQDKKRRVLMFYKQKQQERKKAAKVKRPLTFSARTPLSALLPGMQITGIVISLTPFGAYIDVGTECDGLLHVSQISRTTFIEHASQVLTPGQEVTVRIRSFSTERKKLHLTMLDDTTEEDEEAQDGQEEGIRLEDIQVDDEMWGELTRVTNYGAYVNMGAVVLGFLHFMDTPESTWPEHTGEHPSAYMQVGNRVRVWVSNVDLERQRIKLTANRPPHLPGPRREI